MQTGDIVKLKLFAGAHVKVRLENFTSQNTDQEEGFYYKYVDKSILTGGWAPLYLLEPLNDRSA